MAGLVLLVSTPILSECDLASSDWSETQSARALLEDDGRLTDCGFALIIGRSGIWDGLFRSSHGSSPFKGQIILQIMIFPLSLLSMSCIRPHCCPIKVKGDKVEVHPDR